MSKSLITIQTPKYSFPNFKKERGWKEKSLGDVAEFLKGKGISKSDIIQKGKQPCIRYGELYTHYYEIIDTTFSFTDVLLDNLILSEANDVIIPSSGETQEDIAKASCVLRSGIALGGDLNILRSSINGIFLAYYLTHIKKREIAKLAQGNAVVHLYASQLKNLKIIIPKCESEQNQIAACLSSLDEVITSETQKLDILKNHKKGLLQNLFPHEGETVPKFRFKEFEDSGEWEEKTLDEIGEFTGGGTPSRANESFWSGKVPWISSSDIDDDNILSINISRFISDDALKTSATKLVPAKSILLVSRVGVGKLAITNQPICTSQDFTNFTPNNHNLIFLAYSLKKKKEKLLRFSQGMAIKGFTKDNIVNLVIHLPSIPEQQKIADTFSLIDELISAQNQKVEALKIHKKGLLQGLFPNTITN